MNFSALSFSLQMVFEANTNHHKPSSDGTAVAEVHTRLPLGGGGSMPYVFVRENAIKYWCTVQASRPRLPERDK